MEAGVYFCDELATITKTSCVIRWRVSSSILPSFGGVRGRFPTQRSRRKPRANRTYRNGASWRYTHTCHGE